MNTAILVLAIAVVATGFILWVLGKVEKRAGREAIPTPVVVGLAIGSLAFMVAIPVLIVVGLIRLAT